MARPSIIERSVEIAAPIEDVFTFHLDTRNAALISPAGTQILGVEGTFRSAYNVGNQSAAVLVEQRRYTP